MKIVYGISNVVGTELQCFSNSKKKIDTCMNYTKPPLAIAIEPIRSAFVDAKRRGIKLRYLTEITKDNISYCKELIKIVDELRHLNGIKGNFIISEEEYLAPMILFEDTIAPQLIHSNLKEIVEHEQYVFDTFWENAISAEEKIREIEEGLPRHETRIIEDPEQIIKEISRLTANSNELSTCLTSGGMQYSYNYFFKIKEKLLEKQKNGEHKGIRYITNIEKNNLDLAKIFLNSGIQIRHIKNLPPMSFGVSDKEMSATIEKMEGGKKIQSLLISTEPLYIKHFASIFEELWSNGIDALERIKEIEEDIESTNVEILRNPKVAIEHAWDIIKTAREEVLRIFSSINAFYRQVNLGLLDLFNEVAKQGVRVRILIPTDEKQVRQIVNESPSLLSPTIDIRSMDKSLQTSIGILVVDRKQSLIIETTDDTKVSSYEAAGLSVYSNSKPIALSFASIFESLWKQSELYERLKIHDRMQKEFINIAAHELRTPIQPILGLTGVVLSKLKNTQEAELLEVVCRNAKRLQRLTEDILDITTIESQSLQLKKEKFNLNDVIKNAVRDKMADIGLFNKRDKSLEISYHLQDIIVEADKARISQVISNLLSNATKFTKEGSIIITTAVDVDSGNDGKINMVIVSVKDTGTGIDPEILPRLFSKFVTKSDKGTGLGLYISKSIIESHGGRIWAENNEGGKGAIFYFSLPILVDQSQEK